MLNKIKCALFGHDFLKDPEDKTGLYLTELRAAYGCRAYCKYCQRYIRIDK